MKYETFFSRINKLWARLEYFYMDMLANVDKIDFTEVTSIMMPCLVLFGLRLKSYLEQMKLCRGNTYLKSGCGKEQVLRSPITIVKTLFLWQINTAIIAKAKVKPRVYPELGLNIKIHNRNALSIPWCTWLARLWYPRNFIGKSMGLMIFPSGILHLSIMFVCIIEY